MSTSKIDVSVGDVSFSGEGDQAWLAEQLDRVLKAASEGVRSRPAEKSTQGGPGSATDGSGESFTTPLATYIREKNGDSKQVERFLITADWLRRRGVAKLTTSTVSKALTDNHQKRLSNPADCLIKNISKGFCEKADGGFYITPQGLDHLGR